MKSLRIAAIALLVFSFTTAAVSQSIVHDGRKVTRRVTPSYPDLAKKMNVAGSVKLELLVSANGTVKAVKIIGGHPLLANEAQQVASKWVFETGAESTEQIVMNFTL